MGPFPFISSSNELNCNTVFLILVHLLVLTTKLFLNPYPANVEDMVSS